MKKFLVELLEDIINDFLEWSFQRKANKLFRRKK